MSSLCSRPECGGEQHTDQWGTPVLCPHTQPATDTGRRCPRCDCPDGHEQCDHCKVCPHADGGAGPEAAPELPESDQLRADIESLRYQIRRAREAIGTDEPDSAEAAVARVRTLHREEYGCCTECTSVHAVPYPCPTIRAINGVPTKENSA